MTSGRMLKLAILLAINTGYAGPALAQACSHEGPVVSCDDGRRGLLSGDAIIWPDGTRSSLSPHPSVMKHNSIKGLGGINGGGSGIRTHGTR